MIKTYCGRNVLWILRLPMGATRIMNVYGINSKCIPSFSIAEHPAQWVTNRARNGAMGIVSTAEA